MKETSQEPSSRPVGSVGSGLSSVAQPSPHLPGAEEPDQTGGDLMRTSPSPRDALLFWLTSALERLP